MSSEDLLVAKLKRWTYDEVYNAVVSNRIGVERGEFFRPTGWTREEYSREYIRRATI